MIAGAGLERSRHRAALHAPIEPSRVDARWIASVLWRRNQIRENLFWAFVYNVVGIPIAAGAFHAWLGWSLSPVLASAAMSLSSVSVLANSLRLKWFKPKGVRQV